MHQTARRRACLVVSKRKSIKSSGASARRPRPRNSGDETAAAIARRLKAQRARLGLTLREVAGRSGLSVPFISQAERGHTIPSLVSLQNLARALNVTVEYFI